MKSNEKIKIERNELLMFIILCFENPFLCGWIIFFGGSFEDGEYNENKNLSLGHIGEFKIYYHS